MDIDDDDAPSSSTILVNTPVMSLPGARPVGVTSSDMMSSLASKYSNVSQPMKFSNVASAQPLPGRQVSRVWLDFLVMFIIWVTAYFLCRSYCIDVVFVCFKRLSTLWFRQRILAEG